MKQIVAYIEPSNLSVLTRALDQLENSPGFSFSDVRRFRRDRIPSTEPSVRDCADSAPNTKMEILCEDDQVSEIVWTVEQAILTGHGGEAGIFVLDVCRAVRIHAGQQSELVA